jgi:hypothetical protein
VSSIERIPDDKIPLLGPAEPRGPAGIGGWLLLVAFGQVLATFSLPVALGYQYFDPENRKLFNEFPLAMYGELALNVALILIVLSATLLLFRKSRHFPRVFILECIIGPLLPIVGIVWSAFAFSQQLGRPIGDFLDTDPQELTRLALSVISAAIWIAYALKSKRVRNTFILGLSARDMREAGEDGERLETPLLLVIGAVLVMLGMISIVSGVFLTSVRGAFNFNIVGGAVQVALALLLLRGSNVARIILAFLSALSVVFCVWIAFFAGQQPIIAVVLLTMALLSAVIFWILVFSKRFRAELEINAATHRKPENDEADAV